MPTNTSNIYDTIVIGAGIAGCSIAYTLKEKGQNVLIVDRSAVPASGGSGAAGAFVSPKIGKGGSLQKLTNEAFEYAQEFYSTHFSEHFERSGVVRIPRDDKDAEKFSLYEPYNYPNYEKWDTTRLRQHGIVDSNGGFFFPDAGDCDAPAMCRAMWDEMAFMQFDVAGLEHRSGIWHLVSKGQPHGVTPTLDAKTIVLATGYQNELFDMRYMGVKGLWGSRGDFESSDEFPISLHKTLSVSSSRRGIVKIGATHVKHPNPCLVCDGQPLAGLMSKAAELVDMSGLTLRETFCGMRSGSRDFFPLVGRVVDAKLMLNDHPAIRRGSKPKLQHFKRLFILNGMGGRGFVFAPLMAKWLEELITDNKPIPMSVNPDRLFYKWARRLV